MRLSDLRHTTSFRLALLFAGLFGASSAFLLGFFYWQTFGYVSRDIDGWLARETLIRAAEPEAEIAATLNRRAAVDPDVRRPMALFKADGRWLAGSPASLPEIPPPMDRPFRLTMRRGSTAIPFRGMAHRLSSGDVLLVARDMRDITEFRDRLLDTMASAGAVALLLGLTGAAITGAVALGRLDSVTGAIERIVNGNLSERLPSGRGGGDLNRLIRVVNRMLHEIERLMQEVKGVTENIAHDLRTPLTRLLAGLERVRRRAASAPEYEAVVDEAIVETKGLLATFGALLRIAEIESGARRAGFRDVDLSALVADVAEFYDPVAEGNGVSFSLRSEIDTATEIAGDPSLLFEAIGNLVDNAIKFTPAGGQVTLRAFADGDRFGVEVSDTGPGIPEEEREAVLRRFHRLDKCRSTPGSGLGLSLVAAVAKLHELHLAIEDACPGCRVMLWRDGTKPAELAARAFPPS